MRITEAPGFSLADFQRRWELARLRAVRSAVAELANDATAETELLRLVPADARDRVLRNVFDYSRKLGVSASQYLGLSWEISDLADVLSLLKVPCVGGIWRDHNSAKVLERKGCDVGAGLGAFGCDYWREALDGLVMGVGDTERLARHRSQGHGDDSCVDVLFIEKAGPPPRVVSSGRQASSRRFGPLPEGLEESLREVCERFQAMKIHLVLEGVSENILYYRLDAQEGVLCGAGGKLLHESFIRALARVNPCLIARDASPLAVYGGAS